MKKKTSRWFEGTMGSWVFTHFESSQSGSVKLDKNGIKKKDHLAISRASGV